ncbi:MAG: lipase maturation factor family protein [candidate division Zixibacteria bacterium]|nr:lipase maturation factor family protein [candidate division Zixibacteria bacterium]
MKPLFVFDGACGFCRRWVSRWQSVTGAAVDYAPYQEAAERFPHIPVERFREAVQLIEPDGAVFSGAHAVFRALAHARCHVWLLRLYERVPAAAAAAEGVYQFVSRHRDGLSTLTIWFWGKHLEAPTYRVTSSLFLRALGFIYLVAFVSLWTQIDGLVGGKGILPAADFLAAVGSHIGLSRYYLVPTLAWLNSSDWFLHVMCGGGVIASLLVVAGVAPAPALFLNWALYLSLSQVCREFLGFQWDILLLETGFLAIFLAGWTFRSHRSFSPPAVIWLFRWLAFRLFFLSGFVKLASGDPNWRNLSALNYHYETQPLPTPVAWYAQQLPGWFQSLSVFLMFGIELCIPFLIFLPRRPRLWAFGALVFLQIAIMITGNYCFFNWLAIALCLFLLDDRALLRVTPKWLRPRGDAPPTDRPIGSLQRVAVRAVTILVLLVSGTQMTGELISQRHLPGMAYRLLERAEPFRSINTYGLFAVMTTSRPEIIVEGSNDGQTWMAYEFRWKPGDLSRRPEFVAPHQPRLDWQMWFAALGDRRQSPWFAAFLRRLLEGSPSVLSLLAVNPFPDSPPRYVRARLYDYHFTDFSAKRSTGDWWRRDLAGTYFPAVSLADFRGTN